MMMSKNIKNKKMKIFLLGFDFEHAKTDSQRQNIGPSITHIPISDYIYKSCIWCLLKVLTMLEFTKKKMDAL